MTEAMNSAAQSSAPQQESTGGVREESGVAANGNTSGESAEQDTAQTVEQAFEKLKQQREKEAPDGTQTDDAQNRGNEAEETDGDGEQPAGQSPQENALYAKARRSAEEKAKAKFEKQMAKEREAMEESYRQKQEEIFRNLGVTDPFTAKPIRTEQDYLSWKDNMLSSRIDQMLQGTKITREDLDQVIQSMPEVQQAKEVMAQAQRERDAVRAQQDEAVIASELEQIRKFDPGVQSLEDFKRLDRYDKIQEKVMRGYSFVDAYRSVYDDVVQRVYQDQAQRSAAASAASKAHMQRTVQSGAGLQHIPSGVLSAYRAMGFSDAEALREYEKQNR